MNIIKYLQNKFTHSRPMGRKNFFLTSLIYFIPYAVASLVLITAPQKDLGVLGVLIITAPLQILQIRRARAAEIPVSIIIVSMVLIPFDLMLRGGRVEEAIQIFQIILTAFLIFLPNKVKPILP